MSVPQIDSLKPAVDTLFQPENFKDSATVDLSKSIRLSNEGLDAEVSYGAKDSMWFDVKNKQVHLYGGASVQYTTLTITAGYILLDYSKNEITASLFPDSSGTLAGAPDFKDGQQNFTAQKLRYNFKTKKGIIYEARTQQEDLYVLGERAKFIGTADVDTSGRSKNIIYNKDAIITTCDQPHPHFGIRTKKLKVIPNKLVVTGFSNVEIGGIPTPLVLPFGFFPISQTRKAGLIIPRDFEFADQEGLGIKDFGWYQPINEHMDATILTNIYTSGSWGVSGVLRYKEIYRYDGNFRLRYNQRVREDATAKKIAARSFGIAWSHTQDSKAHPNRRFGGSINIETNRDQNRNRNDFNSVYQNTLNSNLNYSKSFPGKPYQLNIGLTHSQNTQTRIMNISLPSATFTMQRIFPFKKKDVVGKERWYEKISLNYNSQLRNDLTTIDTLLFTRRTLETARIGIQHKASTDYNVKIFKYINISPSVNVEENWYPYQIEKQLKNETRFVYDTIRQNGEIVAINVNENKTQYGIDTTVRNWGFNAYRQFNANLSANTALFLTKQFKKGWLRGFRHTLKPQAGIGFGPDYSKSRYDRFYRTVETDLRRGTIFNDTLTYSIFDEANFGRPPSGVRNPRDLIMNYSLGNIIEFKHFSARRDTVLKKRIFDNLTFSGNYNFTTDSLNWSTIGTGGLFRFFKGILNVTWGATFDPYITNAKGVRVDRFALQENGKLFRMSNLGVQFNTNCSVRQLRDLFSSKSPDKPGSTPNPEKTLEKDQFVDWFDNFNLSHRISFDRRLVPTGYGTSKDTLVIGTNNMSLSGSIQLTSKWSVNLNNISYDFPSKRLVYPDLGFTRDLHCWQLSLNWQPDRGTYLFTINVKPGSLDFLKVPYRKNNFDSRL